MRMGAHVWSLLSAVLIQPGKAGVIHEGAEDKVFFDPAPRGQSLF